MKKFKIERRGKTQQTPLRPRGSLYASITLICIGLINLQATWAQGYNIPHNLTDSLVQQTETALQGVNKQETSKQRLVKITGRITDENDLAIAGVSISVLRSTVVAVSDSSGSYSINAPQDATLSFSFLGYKKVEIPIGDQRRIDLKMEEDVQKLDNVVVVGFGTQKKSSLTAAVTMVDAKELSNRPQPNIIAALQGRVPGLTITETDKSGKPGGGLSILIRGKGTIDGETNPLIVIDGVPGGGRLEDIPAYDIESISVLKDAAAGAIYGARASNGVILVTTKRGAMQAEKPTVSYNFNAGFQTIGQIPTKLSAKEYANLLNEVAYNDGMDPVFDANDLSFYNEGRTDDLHGNTDWQKVTLHDVSPIITNHLAVSGNGKIGSYYVSAEHMYQRGFLKKHDKYERLNLRANVTSHITDNLKVDYSTSYVKSFSPGGSNENHFGNIFRAPAIGNATVSDGHYGDMIYAKGNWLSDIPNVWHWMSESDGGSYNTNRWVIRGNIIYAPIKGLEINATAGYNIANEDNASYSRKDGAWNVLTQSFSQESRNSYSETWRKTEKQDYQVTASYEKEFNRHFFKLMLGASQEIYKHKWISAGRKDYINDTLHQLRPGDLSTQTNDGTGEHWTVGSAFGRFNYNYKEKYLLEVNARYDGSSRFAPSKRWGLFPSFSAGWNIHKENFMSNVSFVDHLKLRGSWGQLGNAEKVGLYLWYPGIKTQGYYTFDDKMVLGARPSRLANPDLSWETTTSYNAGLEAELWQGKLQIEVDLWRKDTKDILLTVPVSSVIGLTDPKNGNPKSQLTVNAGKVSSHGFDLSLAHQGRIGKDWSYNVLFNLSGWNSWIVDLGDRATPFSTEFRPGGDLGDMYGYQCLGIINDDATLEAYKNIEGVDINHIKKGDLHYKDQNGDGKLDHRDVVKVGNINTKNSFGLNLGVNYKGFDLSMFFQGAFNVDRWIEGDVRESFINYRSPDTNSLDRWTEENPNVGASYPRLRRQYTFNNQNSDWWVRNGSYIRMKDLQFGYNLPQGVLSKIRMKQVRVYVSMTNLFTIAPDFLKGYNPDIGMKSYFYPSMSTYSIGLNVQF